MSPDEWRIAERRTQGLAWDAIAAELEERPKLADNNFPSGGSRLAGIRLDEFAQ